MRSMVSSRGSLALQPAQGGGLAGHHLVQRALPRVPGEQAVGHDHPGAEGSGGVGLHAEVAAVLAQLEVVAQRIHPVQLDLAVRGESPARQGQGGAREQVAGRVQGGQLPARRVGQQEGLARRLHGWRGRIVRAGGLHLGRGLPVDRLPHHRRLPGPHHAPQGGQGLGELGDHAHRVDLADLPAQGEEGEQHQHEDAEAAPPRPAPGVPGGAGQARRVRDDPGPQPDQAGQDQADEERPPGQGLGQHGPGGGLAVGQHADPPAQHGQDGDHGAQQQQAALDQAVQDLAQSRHQQGGHRRRRGPDPGRGRLPAPGFLLVPFVPAGHAQDSDSLRPALVRTASSP